MPRRIVILGAGFGGIACARALLRQWPTFPVAELTVIDQHDRALFTPALYEVATAYFHSSNGSHQEELALQDAVCLPLGQMFDSPRVRLRWAMARRVDAVRQLVETDSGPVSYDRLVLALGSVSDDFGIPGIAGYALPLKTADDALRIRLRFEQHFADPAKCRREQIRVVIGGAGFTGCEFAAELFGYLSRLRARHQAACIPQVTLIEAGPRPVGPLGLKVGLAVQQRLLSMGAEIRCNSKISHCTASEVWLHDGTSLAYDLLIWTGGVKANSLLRESFPELADQKGRLPVDQHLAVVNQPEPAQPLWNGSPAIYAIGDSAFFADPQHPRGLPGQAAMAIAQGQQVAGELASWLRGEPAVAFQPKSDLALLPLGGKYAILATANQTGSYDVRLVGWLAWAIKQLIQLRYYLSVLPPRQAFRAWWGSAVIWVRND